MEDITREGFQNYRSLQDQNNELFEQDYNIQDNNKLTKRQQFLTDFASKIQNTQSVRSLTYNEVPEGFGDSRYNRREPVPIQKLSDLEDYRAKQQSGLAKFGAGLSKGISLAGTTFIDGTLGLVVGIGTAIAEGRWSGLWDNEVSNALQDLNENMEKWLPNYRTKEEMDRPWYKNLGTMNFWADGVLKNMGFTVGAFYSGNAWLGALKGVKALTLGAKAANIASKTGKSLETINRAMRIASANSSGLGAQALGSFLSGFNEGRIEANNNSRDFLNLETQKIEDAYNAKLQEINQLPLELRQGAINELESNKRTLLQDAQKRADGMGLADLIGNTVLLTATNWWQFGKLYSRGFNNAKTLSGRIRAGAKAEAAEGVVEREVTDAGIRFLPKKISGTAKGISNAFSEGFEEMNQKWIATSSGIKRSADSPDAYYEALTNPDNREDLLRTNSSLVKGFVDTYGNGDNWEEFAIGFVTGALGMPTVGRLNNSDANTWVGRGKAVGISGGILGEIADAKAKNKQAKDAADKMNSIMEKLAKQQDYLVQSKAFTDAMDGFSEENNKFEYKNASDNDNFAAIAAFANTGRMEDLMEIVNQDYENMSQEDLHSIAVNTTPGYSENEDGTPVTKDENGNTLVGGWRNEDGTLMTSTEEGTETMRQELINKRDTTLKNIKDYVKSIQEVRAIANGSLSDSQLEELAWLNYKGKQFRSRYSSLRTEDRDFYNTAKEQVDKTLAALDRIKEIEEEKKQKEGESKKDWNARLTGKRKELNKERNKLLRETSLSGTDLSTEEGQAIYKSLQNLSEFIDMIRDTNSPELLGRLLNLNKKYLDFLQDNEFFNTVLPELFITDTNTYRDKIQKLQDIARIGIAAEQFNKRYIEFIDNPLSQQQNRDKLDTEVQQDQERKSSMKNIEDVKDMSVKDLREEAAKGNVNLEDLANNKDLGDIANKAKEALDIDKKINDLSAIIDTIPNLDEQVRQGAQELLYKAGQLSSTVGEVTDLATEVYQDISNLPFDGMSKEDLDALSDEATAQQDQKLQKRQQEVLGVLANAINIEEELQKQQQGKLQNLAQGIAEAQQAETEETGHDRTPSTPSVQQQKAEQQKVNNQDISVANYVQNLITNNSTIKNLPDGLKEPVKTDLTALLVWVKKNNQTDINTLLNKYIKPSSKAYNQLSRVLGGSLDPIIVDFYNESKKPTEQPQPKEQEPRVLTTNTDPENLNDSAQSKEEYSKRSKEEKSDLPKFANGKNRYWRRNTPSYIIDKTTGKPVRYEPTTQRDKAVVAYHEKEGTFDRIDNGEVQEGDEVFYIIDDKLNEDAGEIIILMAKKRIVDGKVAKDTDGNPVYDIIGDVSSKNSQGIDQYEGLKAFIERVEKEYGEFKKANKDSRFVSKETNHVSKLMSGYRTYTENTDENRLTLNEIFENKPIKLGVAVSDGSASNSVRIKPDNSLMNEVSKLEGMIIKPISSNVKKGQPFLLIETGNKNRRGYLTVPISMPRIQKEHSNKTLYKSIEKLVELIVDSKGDKVKIMNLKDYLLKFVNIPSIFFEFDNKGNLTKVIRYVDNNKKIHIAVNPSLSTEEIVKKIMSDFEGLPYRVDRQMLGSKYNGQDYNSMIGELAETNLPKGFTHTIGNWFVTNILDANGKEIKAQAPRSIGNTADQQPITNDIKNNIQQKGKPAAQQTQPQSQEKSTTSQNPPQTLLDTDANEILKGIAEIKQEATSNNLEQQAKDRKLFTKFPTSEKLWKAMSVEEKEALLNIPETKMGDTIRYLGTFAFDSKTNTFKTKILKKSLIQYLNEQSGKNNSNNDSTTVRRLRKVIEGQKQEAANTKRELNMIAKALPQLSRKEVVTFHNGLIKISTSKSPEYAWGKFQDGIITLSDAAARGTLYHESFHFVFNSLLTDDEIVTMYNAAKEVYGDKTYVELEEDLAEDFRRYIQFQEELEAAEQSGNIQEWNRIKSEIESLLSKLKGKTHILNSLFFDIHNRKYAERAVNNRNAAQIATEREMQQIRQDAIARGDIVLKPDGSFDYAKAPNGNRSNLNERQWLQVRTKAFKDWFGDWEKLAKFAESLKQFKNKYNGKEYESTDEFRRVQEESRNLLPEKVSEYHQGGLRGRSGDPFKRNLGRIYEGLLTRRTSSGLGSWSLKTILKGKNDVEFRIGEVNPKLFHDIFEINRNYLENGELVDIHDDYSECKCFITNDGLAGFAIEPDGNLVSVFSLNPSDKKGFLYAIKDFIREEGATHLDCYNSNRQNLESIYAKTLGFYPASRMDYNMEYDHDDIAKNHGNPQVSFMVDHEVAAKEFNKDQYDKAEQYQKEQLNTTSKVVDENSEPLVVYHATKAKFNIFDSSFAGTGSGNVKNTEGSFYFGRHKETVLDVFHPKTLEERNSYNIMEVFLNLKNPNIMELEKFNKTWFDKESYSKLKTGDGIIGIPRETPEQIYERKVSEYNEKKKNGKLSMFDRLPKSAEEFMEETSDHVYVVFDPNQIKSATDNIGTFSEEDDIRYRRIGQEKIDQINNQITQTENDLNKSISKFNMRLNQVKEKYDKAISSLYKRNKLTMMGKDYYYIDTGSIVDETTKSSFLYSRNMEDFGQVIAHNNHWTIIIPIINNKNDLIQILEEKDITFQNFMEEISFYKDRLSTLQVYKSEAISQLNDAYSRIIKSYKDSKMMYDMLDSYGRSIIEEMGFTQESWDESLNSFDRDNIGFCRL